MVRIGRLDLDQAAPGVYAIRSSSGTVYIIDHDPSRGSWLMRAAGSGAHPGSGWDDEWVPLVSVESDAGTGVIVVGARAKWLADGGALDPEPHGWLSGAVTSIERWSKAAMDAFLAGREARRRARLDEVLDSELPRWASVLDRLGREDEPGTPNAEGACGLRRRDRPTGPNILDALNDQRQDGSDTPPQ